MNMVKKREGFSGQNSEHGAESQLENSNYEEIVRQLDIYYGIVKRQLINYQSPITGLFPVVSSDDIVGSVRDSIYCAAAIWSLYQAYKRIDDDRGKSYELGQSAVKCMRGILECWIKQSSRIELFKKNQCNTYALHCKFHLTTGEQIYPDTHANLQVDVISLYLLYLVQMITSGLQIIYTQDEVAFVQNLVYYLERAYRTPDFGMWERGTKYNNGTPEIHASSIGMAKSALEAVNGCNLFGDQGASWSVIYVDIDAHNRNRSIFDKMLPRESSSKDVDAALLPTISYPAFATHQENLVSKTKKNVIEKLKGKYGIKRFCRDGYKTVLEDSNSSKGSLWMINDECMWAARNPESMFLTDSAKAPLTSEATIHNIIASLVHKLECFLTQYYREGETKMFENIECEWPFFYIYMIIDGVFKNQTEQVEEYQNLLKSRIKTNHCGDPLIPMYFYVAPEDCESERMEPGKAIRCPSAAGSPGNSIFLWGQALFVIAQLLTGGLLHINELDPIRRYLPPHNRPRKNSRYSAFQGTATDLVVQIVLIAESMRLQAMMATYGIQTQTPHQVEPVQIWSSSQLVKVYEKLGVNSKLNLQGRPPRPFGALGTSKIYRICGMTVLCYPLIFEVSEFYLYRDMALLIDDIKTELQFVSRHWRLSGRPTVCLLIREEHMRDPQFKEMLDLMAMLKKGYCNGTKVRIGRLQNLISSSCIEHLDFMNVCDPAEINTVQFKQLEHDYIGYQSLTDVPRALAYPDDTGAIPNADGKSMVELIQDFRNTTELRTRCQLLSLMLRRENENYEVNGTCLRDHIKSLYFQAGIRHCWDVVRHCSSLLNHTVDSISPFITAVLVNGKQLTVGVVGHEEIVIDKPMIPAEIQAVMYNRVQPYNIIQAVLQQEVVLYCGRLIAAEPNKFKGILKIRVGWVLEAMKLYLSMKGLGPKPLECYSPHEVRQLLHKVLSVKEWTSSEKLSVFERRQLEGCLCRVPSGFYGKVWDVLCRTPAGIRIGTYFFPQQPTLSNMTRSELNFALLVQDMLNHISQPEYRQIIVELLSIVSTILIRNPELKFQTELDLDLLVSEAIALFGKDNKTSESDRKLFFSAPSPVTAGYLARAVVNNLLQRSQVLTKIESDEDYCKVS